ncbi:MAG TPA: DUF177 domain-containing protein [Promineifilum sp.]|mgnify:CR=1 FL=1|nr:DUF177 domain-containing protein [Promineifilum sp.]HRO23622.1 DUF177 domain-containing protein [Promineifilum sp.]HRO88890.1 DUF177 domain-containing protein [Promineifilum sp.]HRQ11867.1 DUF177 domain-containing protein [Promineifilum sp.]
MKLSRLRFNFGFLLEADYGTIRQIELDYPSIKLSDDVTLTPLVGFITATRTTEGIYIQGQLESSMSLECVRCLEEAIVPVNVTLDELFYYPPHIAPPGEQHVGEDGMIDLAPLVRELSLLSVPIKVLCRPDCQGLCLECGANLNLGECGCETEEVDPRLAVLQSLLKNDPANN